MDSERDVQIVGNLSDSTSWRHDHSQKTKPRSASGRESTLRLNTLPPPSDSIRSELPAPGRFRRTPSAADGLSQSQPRSPRQQRSSALHTTGSEGSLDVRLGQSSINDTRQHGSQHNKSFGKRTGDEALGPNALPPSDHRPSKQPFSPSSSRGHRTPKQSYRIETPPYAKGGPAPDLVSSVPTSPEAVSYYHNNSPTVHENRRGSVSAASISPGKGSFQAPVLVKQPSTKPITESQLINEVKGIYAGLVMVEKKCVEIVAQQSQSTKRLSDQQWKALVALHRTLLQEHHDFFSASQHPTASETLKKLAIKYAMPARMWRHGIHAFLELLRHRLPDSMEHMLSFIYLAYSMMALLKESVPSFVETWIECLGDLARYRMAIEDSDPRDREVWSNVAKMWYNEAADKSPNVGRIQHHLAVLARPNIVEQLFYYDKALISEIPFVNARESIMLLFDMFLKNNEAVQSRYPPTEYAFVHFYALLFTRQSPSECRKLLELFQSSFGGHLDRAGARFKIQGPQMTSALFAGLLDFGKDKAWLWDQYVQQPQESDAPKKGSEGQQPSTVTLQTSTQGYVHDYAKFWSYWANLTPDTPVKRVASAQHVFDKDTIDTSEDVAALAALMVKVTVSAVASRMGDKNLPPSMHVVLAILWDLAHKPGALTYVEACIPWELVATFLNTLGRSGIVYDMVESEDFPTSHGGYGRQLSEDFVMRGMKTTRHYYKAGFFDEPLVDEDERAIELPSHQAPRAERCLYLGVRLSKLGRYLKYDSFDKSFEVTAFARSLAALHT